MVGDNGNTNPETEILKKAYEDIVKMRNDTRLQLPFGKTVNHADILDIYLASVIQKNFYEMENPDVKEQIDILIVAVEKYKQAEFKNNGGVAGQDLNNYTDLEMIRAGIVSIDGSEKGAWVSHIKKNDWGHKTRSTATKILNDNIATLDNELAENIGVYTQRMMESFDHLNSSDEHVQAFVDANEAKSWNVELNSATFNNATTGLEKTGNAMTKEDRASVKEEVQERMAELAKDGEFSKADKKEIEQMVKDSNNELATNDDVVFVGTKKSRSVNILKDDNSAYSQEELENVRTDKELKALKEYFQFAHPQTILAEDENGQSGDQRINIYEVWDDKENKYVESNNQQGGKVYVLSTPQPDSVPIHERDLMKTMGIYVEREETKHDKNGHTIYRYEDVATDEFGTTLNYKVSQEKAIGLIDKLYSMPEDQDKEAKQKLIDLIQEKSGVTLDIENLPTRAGEAKNQVTNSLNETRDNNQKSISNTLSGITGLNFEKIREDEVTRLTTLQIEDPNKRIRNHDGERVKVSELKPADIEVLASQAQHEAFDEWIDSQKEMQRIKKFNEEIQDYRISDGKITRKEYKEIQKKADELGVEIEKGRKSFTARVEINGETDSELGAIFEKATTAKAEQQPQKDPESPSADPNTTENGGKDGENKGSDEGKGQGDDLLDEITPNANTNQQSGNQQGEQQGNGQGQEDTKKPKKGGLLNKLKKVRDKIDDGLDKIPTDTKIPNADGGLLDAADAGVKAIKGQKFKDLDDAIISKINGKMLTSNQTKALERAQAAITDGKEKNNDTAITKKIMSAADELEGVTTQQLSEALGIDDITKYNGYEEIASVTNIHERTEEDVKQKSTDTRSNTEEVKQNQADYTAEQYQKDNFHELDNAIIRFVQNRALSENQIEIREIARAAITDGTADTKDLAIINEIFKAAEGLEGVTTQALSESLGVNDITKQAGYENIAKSLDNFHEGDGNQSPKNNNNGPAPR